MGNQPAAIREQKISRAVGAQGALLRQVQRAELAGVGLLAGLLVGPSLLGWISPDETMKLLAEIGIILLLPGAAIGGPVGAGLAALEAAPRPGFLSVGFLRPSTTARSMTTSTMSSR